MKASFFAVDVVEENEVSGGNMAAMDHGVISSLACHTRCALRQAI